MFRKAENTMASFPGHDAFLKTQKISRADAVAAIADDTFRTVKIGPSDRPTASSASPTEYHHIHGRNHPC
jgi:hypothetical protein